MTIITSFKFQAAVLIEVNNINFYYNIESPADPYLHLQFDSNVTFESLNITKESIDIINQIISDGAGVRDIICEMITNDDESQIGICRKVNDRELNRLKAAYTFVTEGNL